MESLKRKEIDTTIQRHEKRKRLARPTKAFDPSHSTVADEANLCARCAKIDPDAVFARKYRKLAQGKLVAHLGKMARMSPTCLLCRLLLAIKPAGKPPASTFSLYSYFSDDAWGIPHLPATILLAVIAKDDQRWTGTGFHGAGRHRDQKSLRRTGVIGPVVVSSTATVGVRRLDPERVDLVLVRTWMESCFKNHSPHCSKLSGRELPPIGLIDCQSRKVIRSQQSLTYLALSYVWGQTQQCGPQDSTDGDFLPAHLPKTIEDAMSLTSQLGFHYLWVDKYCIDQTDDEDKHIQIQNMDQIYANAELTIVAAFGSEPTAGLPGVGGTPRSPQPVYRIGEYLLASSMPNIQEQIITSRWNSRGWTYQEGVLSRRRLYFTENQVYFECNRISFSEAIAAPPSTSQHFEPDPGIGAVRVFSPFSGDSEQYWDHINRYETRTLSFSSDILNGILGVLRAIKGVPHIWGVPLLQPTYHMLESWRFASGLTWYGKEQADRRPGFPSWSWTGWIGGVNTIFGHDKEYSYGGPHRIPPDFQVSLELGDGRISTIDELGEPYLISSTMSLMPFIQIEAKTVSLRLEYFATPYPPGYPKRTRAGEAKPGYWVNFQLFGSTQYSYVWMNAKLDRSQLHCRKFLGILIGGSDDSYPSHTTILVTTECEHCWERIGTTHFPHVTEWIGEFPSMYDCHALSDPGSLELFWRKIRLG